MTTGLLTMTTGLVIVPNMTMHVREVEPADAPAVLEFFEGLSDETAHRRFFGPPARVSLEMLSRPDGWRHVAVMAVDDGVVAAVASYHRTAAVDDVADLAVVVSDGHRRRGVGTRLVQRLSGHARSRGISRFTATVLADNRPALRFVGAVAPQARRHHDGSSVDFDFAV
jgi:GNAT superfamily N-acetyltransferase